MGWNQGSAPVELLTLRFGYFDTPSASILLVPGVNDRRQRKVIVNFYWQYLLSIKNKQNKIIKILIHKKLQVIILCSF